MKFFTHVTYHSSIISPHFCGDIYASADSLEYDKEFHILLAMKQVTVYRFYFIQKRHPTYIFNNPIHLPLPFSAYFISTVGPISQKSFYFPESGEEEFHMKIRSLLI